MGTERGVGIVLGREGGRAEVQGAQLVSRRDQKRGRDREMGKVWETQRRKGRSGSERERQEIQNDGGR